MPTCAAPTRAASTRAGASACTGSATAAACRGGRLGRRGTSGRAPGRARAAGRGVRLDELDYELPAELDRAGAGRAARRLPAARGARRAAPALALDDRRFATCRRCCAPGDVLVRNDTRVIPARAHFRKPTGGRVELLFLERAAPDDAGAATAAAAETWEVAAARGRLRGGETLRSEVAPDELAVVVGRPLGDGRCRCDRSARAAAPLETCWTRYGETPLPPYIRTAPGRPRALPDRLRPRRAARPRRPRPACTSRPTLDRALRPPA